MDEVINIKFKYDYKYHGAQFEYFVRYNLSKRGFILGEISYNHHYVHIPYSQSAYIFSSNKLLNTTDHSIHDAISEAETDFDDLHGLCDTVL